MSHTEAFLEIDKVADSLKLLFGAGAEGARLGTLCEDARKQVESLALNRGLSATPIAIIGAKNAGKSWLCRRLITDPANRERIFTGLDRKNATTKAMWIGPSAPKEMDASSETHLKIPREGMVDLGAEYVLLDLPGYNDVSASGREKALRSTHGALLRVLVVSSETMEEESQFPYISKSDGVRILPVIIDDCFPSLLTNGGNDLIDLVHKIRKNCPTADILDPIVIPHSTKSAGTEDENNQKADDILLPAITELLAKPMLDPMAAINSTLYQFQRAIALELHPLVAGIFPAYNALVTEEAKPVARLLEKIIGSDSQLYAVLSMKMRIHTVSSTPAFYFPYRTILGVFALTAGAWDRMAFALAGSIPSLALLAFQTAQNLKQLDVTIKEALSSRIESMATESLSALDEKFVLSIKKGFPLEPFSNYVRERKIRLSGLEVVTERSTEVFEEIIRKHSPGKWLTGFWGAAATAVFLGLGASPAFAVYREFMEAWTGMFAKQPVHWQAFPTPSGSMIFSTLLIMLLPVILCAFITIVNSAPRAKVSAAVEDIKLAHKKLLGDLIDEKAVRLAYDDPVRDAVRVLLDFIGKSK